MIKRLALFLCCLAVLAVAACEQRSPTAPSLASSSSASGSRGTQHDSGDWSDDDDDDHDDDDDDHDDDDDDDDDDGDYYSSISASLTASPTTIQNGQSSTLTWRTSDATRVTLNGVAVALDGSRVVSPAATTTYTLVASSWRGSVSRRTTVTVSTAVPPPVGMPAATLTATPASIQAGQSATLAWTSTGATTVTLNGATVAASGSQTVSPATTATYTLRATNAAGTTTSVATVTVSPAPPPPVPMPTATLTATPASIQTGQSATLSWTSTDATTVTLNGATVGTSGSQVVSPAATTTYTLRATNAAGTQTASATVTVTAPPPPPVPMPTATLTANPTSIQSGLSTTLSWTSANATTVTLDGAPVSASGSRMVSPAATTTYTLRATNATGVTTVNATVTVVAPPPPPVVRLTYAHDVQPILQTNCVMCHSGPSPSSGVDLTTYTNVMRQVTPGDPNSLLVRVTQPGGKMHGFLSPDPLGRAETIRRWVVDFAAAEQ